MSTTPANYVPYTPPPADLAVRLVNLVGAAVDVTSAGGRRGWTCHGCGAGETALLPLSRTSAAANEHAGSCRAAFHRGRAGGQ